MIRKDPVEDMSQDQRIGMWMRANQRAFLELGIASAKLYKQERPWPVQEKEKTPI